MVTSCWVMSIVSYELIDIAIINSWLESLVLNKTVIYLRVIYKDEAQILLDN
jgi:hypothetical protein